MYGKQWMGVWSGNLEPFGQLDSVLKGSIPSLCACPFKQYSSYFCEPALLNHGDHRIHRIPFTSRRPTLKEAKRICHLLGTIHYVNESSAALGTEASVNIDGAAAVGIRVPSDESNVLLESEKTGKSIKVKPPKGKLNDVTSSAPAVAVTSVPPAADHDPARYIYDSSACSSKGWKQ
jgi:hypothetical protein